MTVLLDPVEAPKHGGRRADQRQVVANRYALDVGAVGQGRRVHLLHPQAKQVGPDFTPLARTCLALQAGGQLVVAVEEEEGRWPGVCKVCCRPKGPKGLLAEQFRQAGIAAYVVEGVFKVDEECDCVHKQKSID